MEKKGVLIILLFIIIIGMGFFIFNENLSNNKFQVGSSIFELPNGYAVGSPNKFGGVNITDGTYSIFLVEHNDSNVSKYINDYQNSMKNQNKSVQVFNSTVEGFLVYKSINIDSPDTVHYWIVKNGKTYEMYKWDENPKMESIVIDLIKFLQ